MEKVRGSLCYIFIALWMLYYLQEMLMIAGVIAQSILVVLMTMSFYAFLQVNLHYKTGLYIKWLNVMIVILTIYGLIPIIGGYTFHKGTYSSDVLSNYTYLQGIYISVMPIYAFYYYSLKKLITQKDFICLFFVLFVFSVVSYYQNFFNISANTNQKDIVNNVGYLFVPLIPMLSFVKIKMNLKYLIAIVILAFIILSMKRGAILTGTVMLLLFMKHQLKVRSKTQLVSTLGLILAVVFVMFKFVQSLYVSNAFFQKRLILTMSGYSSNRDALYSFFWHHFIEKTSIMDFFFGHGANGTIMFYGHYAHNDWLEFAINQGVLGLILYMVYWGVFVFEWKTYKGGKENKQVFGDIMIAYFLITLFSMSFGNMPLCATLCIGYCLAMNYARKGLKQSGDENIGSYLHPLR